MEQMALGVLDCVAANMQGIECNVLPGYGRDGADSAGRIPSLSAQLNLLGLGQWRPTEEGLELVLVIRGGYLAAENIRQTGRLSRLLYPVTTGRFTEGDHVEAVFGNPLP